MIRTDCRHFRAAKPCVFNKIDGSECPGCQHVAPFGERILVIKLDAIGDVLRSACLLPAIIARHDRPYIAWLTRPESAELVSMMRGVDETLVLAPEAVARLAGGGWSHVYSLSNDLPSASLATLAAGAAPVSGFFLRGGTLVPSNEAARAWLELAAFDRLKKINRETYQARMLAILDAAGQAVPPPALDIPAAVRSEAAARVASLFPGSRRRRVGINAGSGARWPKKMLDEDGIVRVITALLARADVDILLLGAEAERAKTEAVLARFADEPRVAAALTGGSIGRFVATLAEVHVLLCGDTLALHGATAIGLPTVAVFGPTSLPEIEDFGGLVSKVAADGLDCLGCYGDCDKQRHCMALLDTTRLAETLLARLGAA
ncbi:MAG: glycosyltransferase family 9 protein [Rhodospirillales bacterium]|nr:glycosyltransferase family 9 protein [Rhodospirillales bacterium]